MGTLTPNTWDSPTLRPQVMGRYNKGPEKSSVWEEKIRHKEIPTHSNRTFGKEAFQDDRTRVMTCAVMLLQH